MQNKSNSNSPTYPNFIDLENIVKLIQGPALEKKYHFLELVRKLHAFELSDATEKYVQQMEEVNKYFEKHVAKEEPQIKEWKHFELTNAALLNNFSSADFSKPTLLPANTINIALCTIASHCSNKEVLEKMIEVIGIEQEKDTITLLSNCVDKEGYNILHCLADLIVKKVENGVNITTRDWESFDYFSSMVPSLKEQKDDLERTPIELVEEQTGLVPQDQENRLVYKVPRFFE